MIAGPFVGTVRDASDPSNISTAMADMVSAVRRCSVSHSLSVRDGSAATRGKPGRRTGRSRFWDVALIPRASEKFGGGAGAVSPRHAQADIALEGNALLATHGLQIAGIAVDADVAGQLAGDATAAFERAAGSV